MSKVTKSTDPIALVVLLIGIFVIVALVLIWPTMIMFGVVHGFWPVIPAFGFWQTFLVSLLARLVVGNTYSPKVAP